MCRKKQESEIREYFVRINKKMTKSLFGFLLFAYCEIIKKLIYFSQVKHYSVYACGVKLWTLHGCHVTTIEGLGSPTDDLIHPIQEALYKNHGVQCGFCSPGMVRTYIIHSDILEKSYPNKYMQYGFIRNTLVRNS